MKLLKKNFETFAVSEIKSVSKFDAKNYPEALKLKTFQYLGLFVGRCAVITQDVLCESLQKGEDSRSCQS